MRSSLLVSEASKNFITITGVRVLSQIKCNFSRMFYASHSIPVEISCRFWYKWKCHISLNLFQNICLNSSECETVVWVLCLCLSLFLSIVCVRFVISYVLGLLLTLALYECGFSPFYHSLCSLLLRCSPLGLPGCWMRISTNNPSLIWLVMCMLLKLTSFLFTCLSHSLVSPHLIFYSITC